MLFWVRPVPTCKLSGIAAAELTQAAATPTTLHVLKLANAVVTEISNINVSTVVYC